MVDPISHEITIARALLNLNLGKHDIPMRAHLVKRLRSLEFIKWCEEFFSSHTPSNDHQHALAAEFNAIKALYAAGGDVEMLHGH